MYIAIYPIDILYLERAHYLLSVCRLMVRLRDGEAEADEESRSSSEAELRPELHEPSGSCSIASS